MDMDMDMHMNMGTNVNMNKDIEINTNIDNKIDVYNEMSMNTKTCLNIDNAKIFMTTYTIS